MWSVSKCLRAKRRQGGITATVFNPLKSGASMGCSALRHGSSCPCPVEQHRNDQRNCEGFIRRNYCGSGDLCQNEGTHLVITSASSADGAFVVPGSGTRFLHSDNREAGLRDVLDCSRGSTSGVGCGCGCNPKGGDNFLASYGIREQHTGSDLHA